MAEQNEKRFGELMSYFHALIQLNSNGVNVNSELNAVMNELNKEFGIDVKKHS